MELIDSNCVRREICVLRNGATSGVYYDVKNLVSYPKKLTEVADKMYSILARHYPDCNLLCGVPMGGLPFCSYLSTQFDIPMIIARERANQRAAATRKSSRQSNPVDRFKAGDNNTITGQKKRFKPLRF